MPNNNPLETAQNRINEILTRLDETQGCAFMDEMSKMTAAQRQITIEMLTVPLKYSFPFLKIENTSKDVEITRSGIPVFSMQKRDTGEVDLSCSDTMRHGITLTYPDKYQYPIIKE